MFKSLALLCLLATVPTFAQTATAPPAQPTVASTCPTTLYAAGVLYNQASSPNLAGFDAIAVPVTKCSSAFTAYSYTQNTVTVVGSGANRVLVDTATTGVLSPVKQFGTAVSLFTFVAGGASTSTSATKGSFSGGGMVAIKLFKTNMHLLIFGQSQSGKGLFGFGIQAQ